VFFPIYMVNVAAYNDNFSRLRKRSALWVKCQVATGLAEDGHQHPRTGAGEGAGCRRLGGVGLQPRNALGGQRFGLRRKLPSRGR